MALGKIYYDGGEDGRNFIRLDNVVACCSRLNGECLKLLGQIMNIVNTDKYNRINTTEVKLPRILLRRIFQDCTVESIQNHAKSLTRLGFIESYSRQDGDNGDFVFNIQEHPVNNPFVLLSVVENEIIELSKLLSKNKSNLFLRVLTEAINQVELMYVESLKNAKDGKREVILQEYRLYLCEQLESNGLVRISTKLATPMVKSRSRDKEIELTNDVSKWKVLDFGTYFTQTYEQVTKRKHPRKGINQCIQALLDYYGNNPEYECMAKDHIDAFFVNYPSSDFDPKVYLMANEISLQTVNESIKSGEKHVPFEKRVVQDRTQTKLKKAKELMEAKQERKGMSVDIFEKLIGVTN